MRILIVEDEPLIVSANTDQALRAFEYGVIDFVPKPFTEERLAQGLARATGDNARAAPGVTYLAVKKPGRVEPIAVTDIAYIRGAGNYSELVLRDGRRELHDKTLEKLEALLVPAFERIHKSYLVRLSDLVALRAYEGTRYEAELRGGMRLPVGRTRYRELHARLG